MTVEDFPHPHTHILGAVRRPRHQGEPRHPGGDDAAMPLAREEDGATAEYAVPAPQSWPRIFPGL